jgi:hypothetical protein
MSKNGAKDAFFAPFFWPIVDDISFSISIYFVYDCPYLFDKILLYGMWIDINKKLSKLMKIIDQEFYF